MFHRFECKIAGRWSGFLCDFTSHIISLAWESDGWDGEFGDEFYFLPSFLEIAPDLYKHLQEPVWYCNHSDEKSEAWFTEKGYERFEDDIERILRVYKLAGMPVKHRQQELPPEGKLVVHGMYQRVYKI